MHLEEFPVYAINTTAFRYVLIFNNPLLHRHYFNLYFVYFSTNDCFMCRLLVALALLIPCGITAQNTIGFPDILNYTKQEYQGGGQNWDATADQRGIMYFANTEGLLAFDGHYWKVYPDSQQYPLKVCTGNS